MVSFYLDGYEEYLNRDHRDGHGGSIKSVLAGRSQPDRLRLNTNIFRVVGTEKWYVVFLSGDVNGTPPPARIFQIQGMRTLPLWGG